MRGQDHACEGNGGEQVRAPAVALVDLLRRPQQRHKVVLWINCLDGQRVRLRGRFDGHENAM